MKTEFLHVFILIWLVVFGLYYCGGPHGAFAIRGLQQMNKQLRLEIELLKDKVSQLQDTINMWNKESFLKEQLAREQLQLAYPEDTVYYIV